MKNLKDKIKNINKRKIKKRNRVILFSICALILVFSLAIEIINLKVIKYEEKKVPVYSYEEKAQIDYQVKLKPNEVYETDTLGPGKIYIKNYVDYINLKFNYNFKGEDKINLEGNYKIGALIEATIEKEKQTISLWQKNYPYRDVQIESTDGTYSINEEISLYTAGYENFIKKVTEESKVNPNINLKIYFDVNTKGKNAYGSINNNRSPYITIPLSGGYFQIGGQNVDENKSAIEKTNQVAIPPSKIKTLVTSILMFISAISIILIQLFTTNNLHINKTEELVKKLLRKNDNRVVKLDDTLAIKNERIIRLDKFENIIKVCDELEKPILYEKNQFNHIFYVLNKDDIYIFKLEGQSEELVSV